jgi:hypothetical protein
VVTLQDKHLAAARESARGYRDRDRSPSIIRAAPRRVTDPSPLLPDADVFPKIVTGIAFQEESRSGTGTVPAPKVPVPQILPQSVHQRTTSSDVARQVSMPSAEQPGKFLQAGAARQLSPMRAKRDYRAASPSQDARKQLRPEASPRTLVEVLGHGLPGDLRSASALRSSSLIRMHEKRSSEPLWNMPDAHDGWQFPQSMSYGVTPGLAGPGRNYGRSPHFSPLPRQFAPMVCVP